MILDLNAKRAARAAKRGEPMRMLLGEETFDLVEELPIEIGEMANNGRVADAFRIMLRDPDTDWDRLLSCRPSFQDVMDVVEFFGTTLGESVASTETSAVTGPPSRPTSTTTTSATSPRHSGALAVSTPVASLAGSVTSPRSPHSDAS
jgi:hypothetical protein